MWLGRKEGRRGRGRREKGGEGRKERGEEEKEGKMGKRNGGDWVGGGVGLYCS